MKQNIYGFILDELNKKVPVVLATIFKHTGSTPRGAGAFMAVSRNDKVQGTIGGGKLEALVKEQAEEIMDSAAAWRYDYLLSDRYGVDMEMVCGGNVYMLLEAIQPEDQALIAMLEKINETVSTQGCGWLLSIVPGEKEADFSIRKAFINTKGEVNGNFDVNAVVSDQRLVTLKLMGRLIDTLALNINQGAQLVKLGEESVFIQPVGQFSKVFMVGAGHVAHKVAEILPTIGFRTIVMDDRPDFLSKDRFPLVEELIPLDNFEDVFADFFIDEDSYLVVVTRGHAFDEAVLKQALATKAGYIGMLGSKKKIKVIFDHLRAGGVSEALLETVHTPIGLKIGADTPEEIAISVAAELIQARAKRKGLKIK